MNPFSHEPLRKRFLYFFHHIIIFEIEKFESEFIAEMEFALVLVTICLIIVTLPNVRIIYKVLENISISIYHNGILIF